MSKVSTPTDEPLEDANFARRNWQLLSLIAGHILFVLAVALWKGPIAAQHRGTFRARLKIAAELYRQGDYVDARTLLSLLETQLWRDPASAGQLYYLRGACAQGLASVLPPERAEDYQAESLAYLTAAERQSVPGNWQIQLKENLGKALLHAGRFREAQQNLQGALANRRSIQDQLYRLQLLAALEQPERDDRRIGTILRQWQKIPELHPSSRDLAEAATQLFNASDFVELRKLLKQSAPPHQELISLGDAAWIEFRTEFALVAGDAETAAEYLATQRQVNDVALASVLLDLQQAHLLATPPDPEAALVYGNQRLELESIPERTIQDALIRQAQIYLDLQQPGKARQLLEQVDGPGPQRFQARYLLGLSFYREAREWDRLRLEDWEKQSEAILTYRQWVERFIAGISPSDPRQTAVTPWRRQLADAVGPDAVKRWLANVAYYKAIAMFEQLQEDQRQSDQKIVEQDYARAMLMTAVSYARVRQVATADRIYENVINFFPNTDFAEAARFLRADNHREAALPRTVDDFKEAAASVRLPYRNEFLPLEELREIFRNAWQDYHQRGELQSAIVIAELFAPFSAGGQADEMLAESALTYAGNLAVQDPTLGEFVPSAEARKYYRDAAAHFDKAAAQREQSATYPDLIWQTALAYYRGQDYTKAAERFREFIRVHGPGERDFLAHLLLANSLMAKEEFAQAKEILENVLESYPSSPDRFEGRIRLAQCCIQLADGMDESNPTAGELYRAAELILKQNTEGLGFDLEPSSREWRDSLFELGLLLYRRGQFEEAIPRLREAVRRFSDFSRSWEAHYQLADAYLQSAISRDELLQTEKTPQGRAALLQRKQQLLQRSLEEFQILVGKLKSLDLEHLTPELADLLMNASFRIGDVLVAKEDWNAAIDAYTTAANRYQNRPECLAAYIAIANAYEKLNRPEDARSTLRQARWVLKQLDEQLFVGSALSRQQWNDRLESLVGNL